MKISNSTHDDIVYVKHIRDAILHIFDFVEGMNFPDFESSVLVQSAVIRQLEIIGEAARLLSDHFRQKYPSQPWHQIIGMRHKLIHSYFGVKLKEVWRTITEDLDSLNDLVEKILQISM